MLSYAALLALVWALFDVPTTLSAWRQPPKILRDLGILLIGTAITVLIVQEQVKINLVSFVTASAVLTAVIGLAAQETLKDLFAGITLQLDPPFRLGDWIAVGESRGIVTGFTLMNTQLSRFDGSKVVLPNSYVAEEQLQRLRAEDPLGVNFRIGLDYGLAPAQAQELLLKVLQTNAMVLAEPAPRVWVESYGDSAIVYEILAYQRGTENYAIRDLKSALLRDIWYALKRQGHSIPYPIRQLHRQPRDEHSRLTDTGTNPDAALAARYGALSHNVFFSALSTAQLQQLARLTRSQLYAPGEAVVVEGSNDKDCYLVMSGTLQVTRRQAASGLEKSLSRLSSGDLFGEMSLLLDAPRSATVRAVDEVNLLQVKRKDLAPLLADDPLLFDQLAVVVERRRQELEAFTEQIDANQESDVIRKMKNLFASVLQFT
ncbi:MAG: mechanosensitive ion channel family protein [Cyanobacteriota bacterium]|nr:mechanosensitive ion channel family protein [Cyanobacteriota bacterium]